MTERGQFLPETVSLSACLKFRAAPGMKNMNAKKLIKESGYKIICLKPIEFLKITEILKDAEVSKQTSYRYYDEKPSSECRNWCCHR